MTIHRLTMPARVIDIYERKKARYVSGVGKDAAMETVSLGWWLRFGDHASVFAGAERPSDWKIGDEFRLILEKETPDGETETRTLISAKS